MIPDLSVVIPTLNEARDAPPLLKDLAKQAGIVLEVVVADGSSEDDTPERCRSAARELGLACRVLDTPRGRGSQLNDGAAHARAPNLLFLHADCRLPDPQLLSRARGAFDALRAQEGHDRIAGHFGLTFRRSRPGNRGAYYFYEAKTRLNRAECINGDQGFWLSGRFLEELGGFDSSLPFLEDSRLARLIFTRGRWITLPGQIITSARRFESEGFGSRQMLNAMIRNLDEVGLHRFFPAAAGAYRAQTGAGRLDLAPFWPVAQRALAADGVRTFVRHWFRTGRYVARNAWQLAFVLDCRLNRSLGYPPGEGSHPWADRYDRWIEPVLDSPPGHGAVAAATAAWFYSAWLRKRFFALTPGKACR